MEKEMKEQLEVELQKEMELENEKEHLSETIQLINQEMLKYIEKRKEMSNYILDYRKKYIEEYRDDEDKIIEYFDHERFVKEEAFKTIDRRLKELTILLKVPYFGKVNFIEEDFEEEENIYVGRFGMTPEGTYEPVIVDWRAPIASLFYAGKLGKVNYAAPSGEREAEILSKRQFIIKKEQLMGMFDSALDVKDDILQWVLSQNTGEKLKDIIMTIQAEQDELIRQPRNCTIVVDGVAGSGKTTVALHRVAYLLYNFREVLQDKVLILGPNNIFMEYISTVLPSLGEVGVKQQTFREFAMELLHIDGIMDFKEYMEKVLNRDAEFIKNVKYKNSFSFIKNLDEYLQDLDCNYYKIQPVVFMEKQLLSLEEIEEMFFAYYKDMPLFRRSKKIKRIIYSRIKDARDEAVRKIHEEHKKALSKLTKEELAFEQNSLEYMKKVKIREVVENVLKTKKELKWIQNANCVDLYNRWNEERVLTADDLAPILYLKIRLEGLKAQKEIKHIVIDEAQDYSLLQFKVLKELTKCNFFTIVGDSNQRITPIEEEIPMTEIEKVLADIEVKHFKLDKSYRSTSEIMEYANQYLKEKKIVPIVRKGEPVLEKIVRSSEELKKAILNSIGEMHRREYENIAIICRDLKTVELISKELKSELYVKVIHKEEMHYEGGVVIIPSYFAKGMEFDAVISICSSESMEEDKLNYVVATRALHELQIYKQEKVLF